MKNYFIILVEDHSGRPNIQFQLSLPTRTDMIGTVVIDEDTAKVIKQAIEDNKTNLEINDIVQSTKPKTCRTGLSK